MQAGTAAARATLDRFFPGAWVAAFFFLAFTRSLATPPFIALTVLAMLGTAYCAVFMRDAWRDVQREHAGILLPAAIMALAVLSSQGVFTLRGGGPAGFVPAQASLLLCLPVLALFLANARIFQAAIGLFCVFAIWHFFMMPLEAITGIKWTWHPVELLPREAWPFKYQASGLALQAFSFVGLFLPLFYLAWGPIRYRRAFAGWPMPGRLMRVLPLLWLLPVASVQSRSALAGALIASALAFLASARRVRLVAWLLLIGCAAVTVFYYLYMSEGKTGPGLRLAYMKLYVRESLDWHWLATGRGFPYGPGPLPVVPGMIPLTHSHNDLVQVFYSWGLPGLLAYLAFWGGMLRLMWTRFVARGEYWPALALIAVVPNMITDVGFHFFEKAAFLVILVAMCIACARPRDAAAAKAPAAGSAATAPG